MNSTAATHDTSRAMVTTWNSERVYSPVLEAAVAIGRKPAAVIRVPVSIGKAVDSQAKLAARRRSKPCSILMAIISTAMIASSTSRPSASTSAPSEILCRPMPSQYITAKVIASTSGIEMATTSPVRKPSEKKLTSSTMVTASARTRTNSPTDSRTASGWSETLRSSMPAGRVCCSWAKRASSASPRRRMWPPSFIATAIPIASWPMKRMRGAAGSANPRWTRATSPRRMVRPPARIGKAVTSSTLRNGPSTRSCTRSDAVSKNPAGSIAFCPSSACWTAVSGMPKVASLVLSISIQTFSSCSPSRSTLPTSATRCSSSWMRSA